MVQGYESLSSRSVPNYIKQLFEAKNGTYGTRCICNFKFLVLTRSNTVV